MVSRTGSRLLALVLACGVLMAVDSSADSALDGPRAAAGEVVGPLQVGAAAVVRPVLGAPGWLQSQDSLRDDVADLEEENAALRGELASADYDRNRLAEYDALTATAGSVGYAMVPARVVAMGPSQSFSATVTIDAGSAAGLAPDMTVVNAEGLVGRVLRVTSQTATVLLIIDPDSVVGARIAADSEMGMLSGRGVVGDTGRLDLELIDVLLTPNRGDQVVTWGSRGGAPYRSGIPIGRVTKVFASLRETSQRAEIKPYVDFGSLDLVGVIVPSGTESDRATIEADGSLSR